MIFAISSFVLSFIYMLMAYAALRHRIDPGWGGQARALNWGWAFSPAAYDEEGKTLCRYGRRVLWANLLCMAGYLAIDRLGASGGSL